MIESHLSRYFNTFFRDEVITKFRIMLSDGGNVPEGKKIVKTAYFSDYIFDGKKEIHYKDVICVLAVKKDFDDTLITRWCGLAKEDIKGSVLAENHPDTKLVILDAAKVIKAFGIEARYKAGAFRNL